MTFKKRDLEELRSGTKQALATKLKEQKALLAETKINRYKAGEKQNLRASKNIKRAIAQLNTLIGTIKE